MSSVDDLDTTKCKPVSEMEMDKCIEKWSDGGPSTSPINMYSKHYTFSQLITPNSKILYKVKNDITSYYEEGKWDDYKKVTNPYEYIFLSWNRRSSKSVSNKQPLSRSYYKMIELWKIMNLSEELKPLIERDGGLITSHAAEGPGGFIEACVNNCTNNHWTFKKSTAITLRSDAKNVPGWRKTQSFLFAHPEITIHDGADGTGNILIPENQNAFVNYVKFHNPLGVHLFTADGGFDFSDNYNAQEEKILPLLIAETLIGLKTLSRGGSLVIKCFDTTHIQTLNLIWLIGRAFNKWSITKPCTSRTGNSERYIIGSGFLTDCDDIINILELYQSYGNFDLPIIDIPKCPTWKSMINDIASVQEQIEANEITIINLTIDLIRYNKIDVIKNLVTNNIKRSIKWCIDHNEPISLLWSSNVDDNITKEIAELIHILQHTDSHFDYYKKFSKPVSYYDFSDFRTGELKSVHTSLYNPFSRNSKFILYPHSRKFGMPVKY